MYILDEILDWFIDDVLVRGGIWGVVGRGEGGETVGPFLSLAVSVMSVLVLFIICEHT